MSAELHLPKGTMEGTPEVRRYNSPEEAAVRETLGEKMPAIIDLYSGLLQEDTAFIRRAEVARLVEDELRAHLDQLAELRAMLQDFSASPSDFETRVQQISQDDNSHTARIRRRDAPQYGNGLAEAQTQLALFAQLRARASDEKRDTVIQSKSLQGVAPGTAMRRVERETAGGRIIVNTIKVFQSGSRTVIVPQAGIEVVKEGDYVDLNGLKPLGAGHFHRLPIPNEEDLEMDDYQSLRRVIRQLAGDKTA